MCSICRVSNGHMWEDWDTRRKETYILHLSVEQSTWGQLKRLYHNLGHTLWSKTQPTPPCEEQRTHISTQLVRHANWTSLIHSFLELFYLSCSNLLKVLDTNGKTKTSEICSSRCRERWFSSRWVWRSVRVVVIFDMRDELQQSTLAVCYISPSGLTWHTCV